MVCDMTLKPQQTAAQRAAEVRKSAAIVEQLVAERKAGIVIGPQGAVTFTGISDDDRNGMTDACILRRITNPAAKLALARAEQVQGRRINAKAMAAGVHSHDGGKTWATH
jgi:hypothetical protein